MSYRKDQRKAFKPKFEEKEGAVKKSGYIYDEDKIDFRTSIPELPTKLKAKPNEQKHKQKVDELQKKLQQLKQQRKQKKQQLKKGSQDFDLEISKLSSNVDLGKKCLVVLEYDLANITQSLQQIEQKIQKKSRLLRNLQRGPRDNKPSNKPYEEMTYEQLEFEQERLSVRVSTANLSKKQESEINNLVSKLARLKLNAVHGQKPKDNTANIENTLQSLDRLKNIKENYESEKSQIQNKIEAINDQIEQFEEQIADLEQQKKNPENQGLQEQCKQLKQQIYKLRDEVAKNQQEYETKKRQYEDEQAKIDWIKWASEVQKRKNQEWQAQRQQRRKQRQKEKLKQKEGQGQNKQKQGKQGEKPEDGKPQRKRINKHQKQIDSCSFLINYCESLIKTQEKQTTEAEKQISKNIESQLNSGQWSKMKGIQVLKSKKNNDDEVVEKNDKIKKRKAQKNKQVEVPEKPSTFTHQFFTVHAFDAVRVVPPTKPEEVEGVLKQLNQKLAYYLQHPEGAYEPERKTQRVEREKEKEKQKYGPKGGKVNQKQSKQRQKAVINMTQFPSLS